MLKTTTSTREEGLVGLTSTRDTESASCALPWMTVSLSCGMEGTEEREVVRREGVRQRARQVAPAEREWRRAKWPQPLLAPMKAMDFEDILEDWLGL